MTKLFSLLPMALLIMCSANKSEEVSNLIEADEEFVEASKMGFEPEQSSVQVIERKLIKDGSLSFEVSDIQKSKGQIETICKELGAYISSETQSRFDDRLNQNLTIRVPAGKFDSLVKRIEAVAVTVEGKSVNVQDITEEFIDTEARLKTKRELEARYREILKQAKTVQEIVSIESQIANVRAEIESMEGRLKFLNNQVSMSTLTVSFYQIIGTDFGFASKFVRALAQGWDNLLVFLIGITNLWPFILLFGVGGWFLNRWRLKRKAKTS